MERTVHGITWKDPLAWMEDMKGKRWGDFIQSEQEHWHSQLKKTSSSLRKQIYSELVASQVIAGSFLFGNPKQGVEVAVKSNVSIVWRFEGQEDHEAVSLELCDQYPGFAWAVEEAPDSKGSEQYALRCYVDVKEKGKVWNHDIPIAPSVAVVDGRVYCLEAKKKLVYFRVVSYNALNGKDRQVHYEEKDTRYNLELVRCNCDTVFVRRQAGPKQDILFFGKSSGVCEGSSLESRRFVL